MAEENNVVGTNDISESLLGPDPEAEKPKRGIVQAFKNGFSCFFRCFCRKQVLMAIAIISAIVLAAVFNKQVSMELKKFMDYCKVHVLVAPLLFAGCVASLTIIMMPTVTLFVGAGYLFPAIYTETYGHVNALVIAIASVSGGLSIGSMIAFALGRSCFREWAEEELAQKQFMKVINRMVEAQGWWIVFLARMSPLMPAEIFNYVCALSSISLGGFAFGSLGSIAPISIWIISSAAGFDAANQASHHNIANITNGTHGANATDGMQDQSDPGAKQRKLMMIAANVVFLFVISLPIYRAYKKFEDVAVETVADMPKADVEECLGTDTPTKAEVREFARRSISLQGTDFPDQMIRIMSTSKPEISARTPPTASRPLPASSGGRPPTDSIRPQAPIPPQAVPQAAAADEQAMQPRRSKAEIAVEVRRSQETVYESMPTATQMSLPNASVRGVPGQVGERRSHIEST